MEYSVENAHKQLTEMTTLDLTGSEFLRISIDGLYIFSLPADDLYTCVAVYPPNIDGCPVWDFECCEIEIN